MFLSVSALLQIKPTHPATPTACHWSSTGNRRGEGTNKPGYVTNDKATWLDETHARAGVWGPGLEHCHIWSGCCVALPSQSESDCQSVQGNNRGSARITIYFPTYSCLDYYCLFYSFHAWWEADIWHYERIKLSSSLSSDKKPMEQVPIMIFIKLWQLV